MVIQNKAEVAVISGGSGMIGSAIARRLAQDGFLVAVLYHDTTEEEITKMMEPLGSGHRAFACDLTDANAVRVVIEKIRSEMGVIGACVHAAGSAITRKNITDVDERALRADFEVTFFGGFHLFKAVAPVMKEARQGTMIGITSAAIEPNAASGRMAGYIPAKYALRGMLRELAREMASSGVTVHAVAPGFIPGGLNADLPERVAEFAREKSPLGRLTTPEDVAEVVSFLCSPGARSLTGLSLPVAAGDATTL